MFEIAVIGAGSWGTALALTLNYNKHHVRLWSNEAEHVEQLSKRRENSHFLPGVPIPSDIMITNSLSDAVKDADAVVMAVPSHVVHQVADRLQGLIPTSAIIISVAKGFEPDTYKRMTEVIQEVFPQNRVSAFSGPSHAEEVGRRMATAIVAASTDLQVAEWVQDLFSNDFLRVYTNTDVIGVEVAGAMKNIIALGCGICYGFGCGDNTEAAVLTRGLVEITRLGVAMGAKEETFSGLAGIGDLVVTCGSKHSRNRRAGIMLGEGKDLQYILDNMGMVVEGVNATKNAHALAERYQVELPITESIYGILTGTTTIQQCFSELMNRMKKTEDRKKVEKTHSCE